MARKKHAEHNFAPRIANRRAHHDYHIGDTLECGIALLGSEVKSVRLGRVSLGEGYATVDEKRMRLTLHNVDIAHYPHAGEHQHDPKRPRVLLAHKREIAKLIGQSSAKGSTLVPLAMYFVRGRAKIEIGVGTGKKLFDKRQDLRKQQSDRDIQRAMTRRVL